MAPSSEGHQVLPCLCFQCLFDCASDTCSVQVLLKALHDSSAAPMLRHYHAQMQQHHVHLEYTTWHATQCVFMTYVYAVQAMGR